MTGLRAGSQTTAPGRLLLTATFLAAAALAGCEGAGEAEPGEAGEPGETSAEVAGGAAGPAVATPGPGVVAAEAGDFAAVDPWVRVAIMPAGSDAPDAPPVNSAGYLLLRNAGAADDAIVAAETDVAETVELHTVTRDEGVMRMRQVESIPVPAGGEAVLEPGGYHIMLIGITRALEEGDIVPLTLRLESGATLELSAPVRRAPPR
jgi:hypothetical protein